MKKLFFFLFFVLFFGVTINAKAAAPEVITIGTSTVDFTLNAGATTSLVFSELISTTSKVNIENAITNGANQVISYSWMDDASSTLIIGATTTATFYNDVKVSSASDIIGSTTPELLLIDSALDPLYQTEPDAFGNATSSNVTPQVVITSPTKEVTMVIVSNTNNPSLDASSLVNNGVGIFPKINLIINSGLGVIGVYMPATTTVTSASSTWDGLVSATTATTSLPESYGQSTISPGFELGSTSTMLTFSEAVRILVPNQAGRGVVYTRGDGIYYPIYNCTTGSTSTAPTNLAYDGDCKIDSTPNLVIWTKHFTKFYTYEEQPKAAVTYSTSTALKAGQTLTITATFDQDLITAPIITLSGANATSTLMVATSTPNKIFTFTHTIGSGNGTTTISLSSSTNAVLVDIVSTPLSGATFQVDNTAPVLSITSPTVSEHVKGTKVISFTDNDLNSPSCSINNTTWVNCTSTVTTLSGVTGFDALADGTFILYLKDSDSVGNLGTTSQPIIKDTYVPSSGGSSYNPPVASSTVATTTKATTTPIISTTTPKISTTTSILNDGLLSIEAISEKISVVTKDAIKNIIKAEEKLVKTINQALTKRLAGRILLQTETNGQAWYLDPVSYKRYYLADGQTSFEALRKFGLGIKNIDITKIPVGLEPRFTMADSDNDGLPDKLEEALGTDPNKTDSDGDGYNDGTEVKGNYSPLGKNKLVYSDAIVNRIRGRIIIQAESKGEAWYVSPVDGRRYYLANGEAAYQIMRYLSLGINNKNISGISVGE
ncbi:MAG: hypothetical protein ACOYL8_04165 [Patescibacteria group bacterium]